MTPRPEKRFILVDVMAAELNSALESALAAAEIPDLREELIEGGIQDV